MENTTEMSVDATRLFEECIMEILDAHGIASTQINENEIELTVVEVNIDNNHTLYNVYGTQQDTHVKLGEIKKQKDFDGENLTTVFGSRPLNVLKAAMKIDR